MYLSVYRVVDLGAVTGGQFLLPIFGIAGFQIFRSRRECCFVCVWCQCVCLGRETQNHQKETSLKLNLLWKISPVAAVGCLIVGLTNGAFRTVGPIFAQELNFDIDQVALFISLWIVAGAIISISLRIRVGPCRPAICFDYRYFRCGSLHVYFYLEAPLTPIYIFIGGFLFGGFALPLYSLSAAQAYDNSEPCPQFVELSSKFDFVFHLLVLHFGPLIASLHNGKIGAKLVFCLRRYTATYVH